jgi:hypothetical protein
MNSLRDNETLEQLYLHSNTITDESNGSIQTMFNRNHTLKILSLGDNQF